METKSKLWNEVIFEFSKMMDHNLQNSDEGFNNLNKGIRLKVENRIVVW